MIAVLLVVFTLVWATPSEARRGHHRSGHGHHFKRGHRSHGIHKSHGFKARHGLGFKARHGRHVRSRHNRGHHSKSRHLRRHHRFYAGYSYIYGGSREPDVIVVEAPPQPEAERETVSEWVPPVMERVKVSGHWSNGIKKTWTGTHWKLETDPDNKIWIEETYKWREKQAGYYKDIKVLVK